MRTGILLLWIGAFILAGCSVVSTPLSTSQPDKPQPSSMPDPPTPSPLAGQPAPYPDLGPAPELNNETWLNVDAPLSLADLRGKVVLIDMWTFG